MTLDELKNHRAHYELYGSIVPLPAEVMAHLFDTAEAALAAPVEAEVEAPAPAKRTPRSKQAD